jgi:hypothetical protein
MKATLFALRFDELLGVPLRYISAKEEGNRMPKSEKGARASDLSFSTTPAQ